MKKPSPAVSTQRSRAKAKRNDPLMPPWSALIQEPQWGIIKLAAEALHREDIAFVLGGALGLAHYTGHLRNTHDADFFLLEETAPRAVDALQRAGFRDYYDQLAYDRGWIFRSVRDGYIVDLIWTTPNRFSRVTPDWFERAEMMMLRGSIFQVIPVEELIWIKLFVIQRSRCDWPDLLNLLRAYGARVDWKRLLDLAGPDVDLLQALLVLFNWTSPQGMRQIPAWVRKHFALKPHGTGRAAITERKRVALLDSRGWYAAFQSPTELMQV